MARDVTIDGPSVALCYETFAGTTFVSNGDELDDALDAAHPGDEIVLSPGRYDGTYKFDRSGTADAPIVVRAEPGTEVEVTGSIYVYGDHVVITGLHFTNGRVRLSGNYNRVTRNYFRSMRRTAVEVRDGGAYNRVDRNDIGPFEEADGFYFGVRITLRDDGHGTTDNRIDHNYIHDFTGWRSNGHAAIQVGSQINGSIIEANTLIDHNRLERVDVDGEAIEIKSSSNRIIMNTLLHSRAYMSSRHGARNQWRSNFLKHVDGIRVLGDHNEVVGNRFVGKSSIRILAGNADYDRLVPFARTNTYVDDNRPAARWSLVAANRLHKGRIYVGHEPHLSVPAQATVLEGNWGSISLGNEEDSVVEAETEVPYVMGRKMRRSEVGPRSRDWDCG